ncbi:MAG: PAS domain S-box protein [Polyangiaceae bacterium]|nr:PAS domain S-box protein [Polyangiaceae bacterium]
MGSEDTLLHKLVDAVPSMLAYWDSEQICRFANRAYEQWFDVKPDALVGKHIRELLGPLYALNKPYIEAVLRGEEQEFEREIPDPRGGPPRHSLACYIPDRDGERVRGFFVIVSNVTQLKRAEQALRESEERFRLTIDEAPIGMAIVGKDGHFLRVNRALCDIVGYEPDELTGLTFQAITHPADLDTDLALAGQLARNDIPRYHLSKRYIRKDGSVVEIMLHGSAVRDEQGQLLYFIAQVEDITEQRKLERRERYLADLGPVLSSSLDCEVTLTHVAQLTVQHFADFCVVDVLSDADEARRLTVACSDQSKQWLCEKLKTISLDRRRPHLLQRVIETRRPVLIERVSSETVQSLAQGKAHLELLRAADIHSLMALPLLAHGHLLGAIALISSLPQRIYDRADLAFAEDLARRSALALSNAQLFSRARRATELRDEVLGVVAHDLRNPLFTILMQARMLEAQPGAQKASAAITRAAERMQRLIEDLLDVTRIEAGRLAVEPTRISAAELIAAAIEPQQDLVSAAGITLNLNVSPGLPEVWADRDRLCQVFENLIGNALKFTARGGAIDVGARPNGGDVLFWVSDTGSGVAPEDLPCLFDRFWQAKRAERRGAGLGLPIVKGIVEVHGGRIWAESTLGRGTTFFFTLPTQMPAFPPPGRACQRNVSLGSGRNPESGCSSMKKLL